jgi:hypothetical protein
MSKTKMYAMDIEALVSDEGYQYTKATTRIGDIIYTAIGKNEMDAEQALMNKISADTKNRVTEVALPTPRLLDTIRETSVLVLLWTALAVLATGLIGIVYKILEN